MYFDEEKEKQFFEFDLIIYILNSIFYYKDFFRKYQVV